LTVSRRGLLGNCQDQVGCKLGFVPDLITILQVLSEYTSGGMLLALTFYCWHLDRGGRATKILKISYFVLACVLLLIMALPLTGIHKLPSYFFF